MKNATELRITETELNGLIAARVAIAALPHEPVVRGIKEIYEEHEWKPNGFSMSIICGARDECGTVHCIGGLVAVAMGIRDGNDFWQYVNVLSSSALEPLFFPKTVPIETWDSITPQMACKAIDHFLDTGEVEWRTET